MKALIIYPSGETEPAHSTAVQTAFVNGGGVDSDLYEITTFNQTVVDYATTNNYDAIIYSYSGEESYFSLANSNPDIMIFMPSDSYAGDLQQLVLTDLLPTTDNAEFTDDTQSSQSDSNGYICGQLFSIASQRNCSLQEARICANATKSEDGIIDVSSAIGYSGDIQLAVGDITAERTSGFSVNLTLGLVIDGTSYKIYRKEQDETEWTLISTQTSLTYTDTISYGVYSYKYIAENDNLSSDYSSEAEIKYGASPIYEITTDTYSSDSSQGFLVITNPFIIYENTNLVFGQSYKINYRSQTQGIKFYNSGSSLNVKEIFNNEVFMAIGKILIIELPENETITFDQLNLVKT